MRILCATLIGCSIYWNTCTQQFFDEKVPNQEYKKEENEESYFWIEPEIEYPSDEKYDEPYPNYEDGENT